jgi:hypothetical protein
MALLRRLSLLHIPVFNQTLPITYRTCISNFSEPACLAPSQHTEPNRLRKKAVAHYIYYYSIIRGTFQHAQQWGTSTKRLLSPQALLHVRPRDHLTRSASMVSITICLRGYQTRLLYGTCSIWRVMNQSGSIHWCRAVPFLGRTNRATSFRTDSSSSSSSEQKDGAVGRRH